ncbi:MAG TPA: hypothetical protein VK589_27445, partial [Chryseolinea sp.]|nr:hypothetical protein [Chryseolinea sp.]
FASIENDAFFLRTSDNRISVVHLGKPFAVVNFSETDFQLTNGDRFIVSDSSDMFYDLLERRSWKFKYDVHVEAGWAVYSINDGNNEVLIDAFTNKFLKKKNDAHDLSLLNIHQNFVIVELENGQQALLYRDSVKNKIEYLKTGYGDLSTDEKTSLGIRK